MELPDDNVLELRGVDKSFGGVKVLDNVDFTLRRGTIHALVGGNGAGKSTLMKILTGVYFSDSGVTRLNGEPVSIESYNDARANGIALIFQELSLIPTLTVSENIFLNKEIVKNHILDSKEMHRRTHDLMTELGIDIPVDARVENLDVGLCQLVEIAKALSENASVLIMDEPTASLTAKETEILFSLIRNLKAKGVSIVYISHRMNEIFRIADEISVLRNGKVVANKPTDQFDMKSLIQAMMGNENEKKMEWRERAVKVSDNLLLEVNHLALKGVFDDISITVRKGEVIGFAGLMGSGRTETLECIFGLKNPDGGEIILDGERLTSKSVRKAIEKGVALVPEDRRRQGIVLMHGLKENLTVTNFSSVRRRGVISRRLVAKLSEKAIKDFDIKTKSIDTVMTNLSGGNQQKVVVAKWLSTNPKLLLMDEPTNGVDVGAKGEIIDIIRNFVGSDRGVIFVSSELSELMAVCDRIYVFGNGRITGEFSHDGINSEEELQIAIQN
ncbi:MAG: sugar ABC transporter ATP-binding protein [Planctomycetes bacterium]|nr:sugar ABC transporter ATP-binding protein [Planctomycetota bacterium]